MDTKSEMIGYLCLSFAMFFCYLPLISGVDVQDKVGMIAFPTASTNQQSSQASSFNLNSYLAHILNRGVLPLTTKLPTTTTSPAETTTSTRIPITTHTRITSTTTKINDRVFNSDGTLNKNRPGMISFPTGTKTQNSDRSSQARLNDVLSLLIKPALYSKLSNTEALTPSTSSPTANYINLDQRSKLSNDTEDKTVPTRWPDVQDKPFTGLMNNVYADESAHGIVNNNVQKITTNTFLEPNGQPDNIISFMSRSNSVVDSNFLGFESETPEGLSCLAPYQFPLCEYYNRCFSSTNDNCVSHSSYLGDESYRLCQSVFEVIKTTSSDILKSYLMDVEQCVTYELVDIIESPTCDDVTQTLVSALLFKNESSCLYSRGRLCEVISELTSRQDLAKLFSKPSSDAEFMMKLLVNYGEVASLCKGEGVALFISDLTNQVRNSPKSFEIQIPDFLSNNNL